MAIQHRRGLKVDFDPNKMLPGEFAYALDTAELFYCYGVGNVKRLATIEDIEILLDTNETAYTALQQLIAELENETVLSGLLADISNLQDNKLDKTGVSSNNTVIFSEASEDEDIVSGESHTTLFGKILKSIKTFRGNISNITTNIGTLASLLTTDRSNLVNAINELHQDHATHLADYATFKNQSKAIVLLWSGDDGEGLKISSESPSNFMFFVVHTGNAADGGNYRGYVFIFNTANTSSYPIIYNGEYAYIRLQVRENGFDFSAISNADIRIKRIYGVIRTGV